MIDHTLPGRPCFERHEIMVGEEVCEVFFRDVIACIRALFGDPDFAMYLVLVPEKHYTDDRKTVRMYHDMHTGKWWWSTQVKLFVLLCGLLWVSVTDLKYLGSTRERHTRRNYYPSYHIYRQDTAYSLP